jgi:hypothetical protein
MIYSSELGCQAITEFYFAPSVRHFNRCVIVQMGMVYLVHSDTVRTDDGKSH